MKKVVLLGDSIRLIGYGTKVPEMLGPEYTVWQPSDNGRYAQYTLHGVLEDWVDGIAGADIIHWNNGLWDMSVHGYDGVFTPLEAYGDFIMRIAKALKKTTGKIIFATTTPVRNHPLNNNEIARKYNEYIVPKLEAEGIIINDLYSLVSANLDDYIREDDSVHLTAAGIDACSRQICAKIKSLA